MFFNPSVFSIKWSQNLVLKLLCDSSLLENSSAEPRRAFRYQTFSIHQSFPHQGFFFSFQRIFLIQTFLSTIREGYRNPNHEGKSVTNKSLNLICRKLILFTQKQFLCKFLAEFFLMEKGVPPSPPLNRRRQKQNKLASLEATLVRNYDPLNHLITDGGKV